jgi:hypothetical protein
MLDRLWDFLKDETNRAVVSGHRHSRPAFAFRDRRASGAHQSRSQMLSIGIQRAMERWL